MKVSNNYDFSCKQKQIGRDINWKDKQLVFGDNLSNFACHLCTKKFSPHEKKNLNGSKSSETE